MLRWAAQKTNQSILLVKPTASSNCRKSDWRTKPHFANHGSQNYDKKFYNSNSKITRSPLEKSKVKAFQKLDLIKLPPRPLKNSKEVRTCVLPPYRIARWKCPAQQLASQPSRQVYTNWTVSAWPSSWCPKKTSSPRLYRSSQTRCLFKTQSNLGQMFKEGRWEKSIKTDQSSKWLCLGSQQLKQFLTCRRTWCLIITQSASWSRSQSECCA